jgi:P-type Cu2+ transporter
MRTPIAGAVEEPGQGVRALIDGSEARLGSAAFCGVAASPDPQSDTSSIVFTHAGRRAVFAIRQRLRADAVAVVRELLASGLDVRILSGDRVSAVEPVASALGVMSWQGGLKPADKIAAIEQLEACGKRVLMVGDGLNDAPALAAAHVSMSPISAAHIAQTHADAVFLGERLAPVLQAVTTARRSRRLMQQNLWLAVIYNAVAVPVAIAGLVTPLIAAAAMSGSSILVTLNALRVRARSTRVDAP